MNKYVEFISDENFEKAVKRVLDAYKNFDDEKKSSNPLHILLDNNKPTIDEFKSIFDMYSRELSLKDWTEKELERQFDKNINNKIGEFHQELLGYVSGWNDLGTGHESGLDLKNDDNTIWVEIKNKYNTMNSKSTHKVQENLENIIDKYPNAKAYWAFIISKNYVSKEEKWVYTRKIDDQKITVDDERIRKISGDKLYWMVTGDEKALEKVCRAIPFAIKNIQQNDEEYISNTDQKLLDEYYAHVFKVK